MFDLDPEHGLLGVNRRRVVNVIKSIINNGQAVCTRTLQWTPSTKRWFEKSLVDTNGRIGQFCFHCHTPLASKLGLTEIVGEGADIALLNALDDKRLESSVSCVACHAVSAVMRQRMPSLPTTLKGFTGRQ